MLTVPRSLSQTLVPALLTFVGLGCASSIAAHHPHLDRRAVCVRVPGIEADATEYVFSQDNVPVSNFHPEVVDRVAPNARTVFEFDPAADPSSVSYLPAPFNQLECALVFSMLPSKDAETSPPPEASVDLLVHERRPEAVPRAVTEKLATCPSPSQLQQREHQVNIIVYVTNDGRAVSAYLAESTLGAPKTEACMVDVLRDTFWPEVAPTLAAATVVTEPTAVSVPLGVKTFFGEPAPALPTPDTAPTSGIRIKPPTLLPTPTAPPAGNPSGFRIPFVGVLPALGSIVVGGIVIVGITLLPNSAAPPWVSEMNPITRLPYRSLEEFRQINQLSPEEIQRLRTDYIKATQPKPPPAVAPPPAPAPVPPPATGTRRNPGQTCHDSVLDELEKQKKEICRGAEWTCSDDFEKIGRKKEKLLTCPELLPRIARGQACLNARLRVQAECYAGSPEANHDDEIERTAKGVKRCVEKAAVRGPGGGPCPK